MHISLISWGGEAAPHWWQGNDKVIPELPATLASAAVFH
jgi:hypothetical protein